LRVIHYKQDLGAQLALLREDPATDAVLIDSRTATAVGGTGIRFDWQAASRSFLDAASRLRLIAAGGLKPENVAEAIRVLHPWGVDVVTGVEAAPGRKDPARVKAFVTAAKMAADEITASHR
jgi:phosphoribosylanthranilate isomerase